MSKETNNYLSIKLLSDLGNTRPTKKQIALMDSLLFVVSTEHKLMFYQKLTNKEIAYLRLVSMGKSANETAELMSVKKTTVDSYYKKIKQKLGCKTIAQAVYEGMRFGYLTPKE